MANEYGPGIDPWVVVFHAPTTYVFGPFEGPDTAEAFARAHGGRAWPLLGTSERDVIGGEPWIEQAVREAVSPLSGTAA